MRCGGVCGWCWCWWLVLRKKTQGPRQPTSDKKGRTGDCQQDGTLSLVEKAPARRTHEARATRRDTRKQKAILVARRETRAKREAASKPTNATRRYIYIERNIACLSFVIAKRESKEKENLRRLGFSQLLRAGSFPLFFFFSTDFWTRVYKPRRTASHGRVARRLRLRGPSPPLFFSGLPS